MTNFLFSRFLLLLSTFFCNFKQITVVFTWCFLKRKNLSKKVESCLKNNRFKNIINKIYIVYYVINAYYLKYYNCIRKIYFYLQFSIRVWLLSHFLMFSNDSALICNRFVLKGGSCGIWECSVIIWKKVVLC